MKLDHDGTNARCLQPASAGSKIVITPVGTSVKDDRRTALRAAAARVRESFSAEFQQLGAEEIMSFIRRDEPAQDPKRRGNR
jgi:hypothetical protein